MHRLASVLLLLLATAKADTSPNSFLTFKIDDPEVREQVATIQTQLLAKDSAFKDYFQRLSTLHVTVDIYNLNSSNIAKATQAVDAIAKRFCQETPFDHVKFDGISRFGKVVFFGHPDNQSRQHFIEFQKMADEEFKSRGIHPMNRHLYHPHMTIVELPKGSISLENEMLEILPSLKLSAGQSIAEIFLCEMHADPKKPFYNVIYSRPLGHCKMESLPTSIFKAVYRKIYSTFAKVFQ